VSGALSWIFSLDDRISTPVYMMTKALGKMVDTILSVGSALGHCAWSFGEFVLQTYALRENVLTSFELMLGTKDAATSMWDEATSLARLTPWGTTDVVRAYQKIIGAGFKRDEAKNVFLGISDIAVGSGFDAQVFDRVTRQFAQMKARGKVTMENLMPILEASSSVGVGQEQIFGRIAANLGKTKDEVVDLESRGLISADVGIFSILEAIRDSTKTKQLGGQTEAQSKTLLGLWSTLKSTPEDYLYSIFSKGGAGMARLSGALQKIIDLFDPAKAGGQRFGSALEKVLTRAVDLVDDLTSPAGIAKIERAFELAGIAVGWVGDAIKVAGVVFEELNRGVDEFVSGINATLAQCPALNSALGGTVDVGQILRITIRAISLGVTIATTELMRFIDLSIRIVKPFLDLNNALWNSVDALAKLAGFGAKLAGFGGFFPETKPLASVTQPVFVPPVVQPEASFDVMADILKASRGETQTTNVSPGAVQITVQAGSGEDDAAVARRVSSAVMAQLTSDFERLSHQK
jgi:tape measure domain-containing protein